MSLRIVVFALLAGFALVACGPSSGQIKTARSARYHTTASEAFQAGVSALNANDYKIEAADPVAGKANTVMRWYEEDGTYVSRNAADNASLMNNMISLVIEVAVIADGDTFQVQVTPFAQQFRAGYSGLFPLKEADPQMTGWISGKVDSIYLSVYDSLKATAGGASAAPGAAH